MEPLYVEHRQRLPAGDTRPATSVGSLWRNHEHSSNHDLRSHSPSAEQPFMFVVGQDQLLDISVARDFLADDFRLDHVYGRGRGADPR